jgi:CxxC motif-containing protein (DUF1111 family)
MRMASRTMLGRIGLCLMVGIGVCGVAYVASKPAVADPAAVARGYEIFNREWLPNDPRSHGGDGLGPVYNETSCVACHNSGGSGGAGSTSKNIDILNASRSPFTNAVIETPVQQGQAAAPTTAPVPPPPPADVASPEEPVKQALDSLVEVHPGFRKSRTVVLHRFGTDPNYQAWRSRVLNQAGSGVQLAVPVVLEPPAMAVPSPNIVTSAEVAPPPVGSGPVPAPVGVPMPVPVPVPALPPPVAPPTFTLEVTGTVEVTGPGRTGNDDRVAERIAQIQSSVPRINTVSGPTQLVLNGFVVNRSQRNPTALFGLGLIDAIPDSVIEARARDQARKSPNVRGRVSRLKDGKIGRLGWKGQTANAEDFVLNACSVEVGLEVPGRPQAMSPQAPRYQPPGLDLTGDECAALVAYVRSLPRPIERPATDSSEAKVLASGKRIFHTIGCAGCHTPSLGDVEGIYSDLLLHDMGPEMADSGSYSDSSDDGSDEPLVPLLVNGDQPQPAPPPPDQPQERKGASRQEWRTPPLWGLRDSAPYLHDGRAETLEQAVAMHGGQGSFARQAFVELSPRERLAVEAFLKSLVAPPSNTREAAGARNAGN